MKATPLSPRPYVPYLLANGNDVVLIGYSGSSFGGLNGHSHVEQHQNVGVAWYKTAHRANQRRLEPLFAPGYQIVVHGEVCEPQWYEQEFTPRTATLRSLLTYRGGIKLAIESFLSDDGILMQTFTVLEAALPFELGIGLGTPHSACNRSQVELPHVRAEIHGEGNGLVLDYEDLDIKGHGYMRCSRTDWALKEFGRCTAMVFEGLQAGWSAVAYTSCADEPDSPAEDIKGIRERHVKAWEAFFSTSSVTLPDSELQYAADLSRYVLRSTMHSSGALPAGMLPSLWAGGICCPYDSEMMQLALLQGGNLKEGYHYLEYYLNQFGKGREIASSCGLKGAAFSNWSDVLGNHHGGDLKRELTYRKPLMISIIGLSATDCCRYGYDPEGKARELAVACAEFVESGFVRDGHIASMAAGNESDVTVDRDSFMLAVTAKLFRDLKELFGLEHYGDVAEQLLRELELNRNADGLMMPYQDAPYTAGFTTHLEYYFPGEFTTVSELEKSLLTMRTPWGCDFDQPSEVYRHWPWIDCHYARAFARAHAPAHAFPFLKHWFANAASTGASPEKIRLDGYAIGYWYVTPYALYLQALYASLAHCDAHGDLWLMYGFDGNWRELEVKNLCLPDGIRVSFTVAKGCISHIAVTGGLKGRIHVNPLYQLKN